MTTEELKRRLGEILAEEEMPEVDWGAVTSMSVKLASDLGQSLPPIAADYLGSVERRQENPVFGYAQRSVLALYLNLEPRTSLEGSRAGFMAEVTLRRPGRTNYRARVFDASCHGCKLELIARPEVGEFVSVKFEGLEALEARVCWTEGFTAEVNFETPIPPSIFDGLVKTQS